MARKRGQKKQNVWDPNYNKDNKSNKKHKTLPYDDNVNQVTDTNMNDNSNEERDTGSDAYITTAGESKIDSKKFWNNIEPRSEPFESYYKALGICESDEEWNKFMSLNGKPLPTTFRINTTIGKSLQSLVVDQLKEIVCDGSEYKNVEIDGEIVDLPSPLSWYPNEMAWKSSIPKKSFRKNPALSKFHHFLVHHNQQGNITRQEAVSMIPPMFLEVQSHHRILDMCAAPGSKTTQILEDLHMKHTKEVEGTNASTIDKPSIYIPTGVIIANDVDTNRCYMLVSQTTRLGSPAIIITNHEAQNFPLLYGKGKDGNEVESPIYLDRILCDVPCSGDGTTRKNPEVWRKWTHAGAIGLHQLQIKIAIRGCHLLKVGGRMVYSTCSMNPVENEAVISEIIQRSNGAIRLVDVSSQYPQLIRKAGLHYWPVIDKSGTYPSFESQPEDKQYKLAKSLFAPTPEQAKEMHLEYCMRVYSHFQDTGGFFIAVLEKVDDMPGQLGKKTGPLNNTTTTEVESTTATEAEAEVSEPTTTTTTTTTESTEATEEKVEKVEKIKREPKIKARDRRNKFFEEPFIPLTENYKKELETAVAFYGITKEFPINNLLGRSEKSTKIYWASEGVMEIIGNTQSNKSLKVINCALKVLQRHDGLGAMECAFRISQDSVLWIEPFISKRIIHLNHDELCMVLQKTEPFFHEFSESLCKQLTELEPGCFFIKISGAIRETLSSGMIFSAWRGKSSMHLLVPKQEIQSYKGIFGLPIEKEQPKLKESKDNTTTTTTTSTTESTTPTTAEEESK